MNSDSLFFNTHLNSLAIASQAAEADATETSSPGVDKLVENELPLERLTLTETRILKRSKSGDIGLNWKDNSRTLACEATAFNAPMPPALSIFP
ncbi:hypothetical protein [Rhizobium oryziradicis]|uniref:hypothetical protein n=1 Tax=Rhizobium oryziradicis TaxID=1867956 RepID=UPI000AFFBCA8|nr:hypothetical protein [Rhizobium oryziradicis]